MSLIKGPTPPVWQNNLAKAALSIVAPERILTLTKSSATRHSHMAATSLLGKIDNRRTGPDATHNSLHDSCSQRAPFIRKAGDGSRR